ncbi:MAG: hypothetical protein KF787_11135 [Phycisphaeraceae bacterium]|nr:hypothetical protein [Phycisphaerae bacterium]MBX3393189.1 hypothetical protein [Phycisphaeraceae bacterium]
MSNNRFAVRGVFAVIVGLLGTSLCVGGCASQDYSHQAAAEIRANATPELDTLYQRPVDIDNAIALTFDENGRMINQDLGRFWLLDRPSRLSPDQMRR